MFLIYIYIVRLRIYQCLNHWIFCKINSSHLTGAHLSPNNVKKIYILWTENKIIRFKRLNVFYYSGSKIVCGFDPLQSEPKPKRSKKNKEEILCFINMRKLLLQHVIWRSRLKVNIQARDILARNASMLQLEQIIWRHMLKVNTKE